MKLRKLALLAVALLLAACGSASNGSSGSGGTRVGMPDIPLSWQVPAELRERLSAEPLTRDDGEFAASFFESGGIAAVTVKYAPLTGGEPSILMTVFWFPMDAFERAQNPNEPPLFGTKVVERDGYVLSVAGPTDAMYDGEDGRAITTLYELMYNPNSWSAD